MKPMSLTSPEDIAREYGGNKKKISEAARIGLLDPTSALLAGMFIDKMRAAAAAEQSQDTTVAQDIFGGGLQTLPTPPQQQVPPMPVQPAPQPQPQLAQAAPPTPQPMMAASGGIMHIPAGDVGNYAGGGIVAFAGDEGSLVTDDSQMFNPFTMGLVTPRDRLAAQLAFPPSEIGKAVNAPTPSMEIPSRTGKARNRLIDPEFRTSDPTKIARAKLDILQSELANQQKALAAAKAPDEKARAEANIREIQREISIASKGKVAPSAAKPDSGIVQMSPDDPRAKALYDERMRRDAGVKEPPPDYVGQARRITEGVYPASEKPTELTVDTAFEQSQKFLDKAGVDLNVFKKQREDIAEERRGYEKDKKQAGAFRILEAAAGILSGESQYGMVNIGKGLAPAVQGLASDVKEFQKNERALRAAERQLAMDEQKFNLTRASDAQAQMLKSQDRVMEYNKNKANLIGDITKSFISTAGSEKVAKIYTEGYRGLEEMRQAAPPDVVKLADRLKADMPGSSERDRLAAASRILRPENTTNAVIGAMSKARQDALQLFSNRLLTDKNLRKLNEKATAGDVDAQRQIRAIQDEIYQGELSKIEDVMPGISGGATPTGKPGAPKVIAPPTEAIQQLRANDTPQMRAYFDQTFGQGAAARALGQ